jgi:Flp pilus assembly protein TadD
VSHEHGYYAALNGDPSLDPIRFVYKQYILQLLHHHFPNLPAWFSQGVAEYYSTFEADEDEARIGRPVVEYVHRLREGPGIPLDALFAAKAAPAAIVEPPGRGETPHMTTLENTADFFATSWALVHHLLVGSSEADRERVKAYLGAIGRGMEPEEAWAAHVAIGRESLGRRLEAYAKQEQFNYLRLAVRSRAEIPASSFPMAEHEVLCRLGDLVLHTSPGRLSVALDHFQKALVLVPGDGPSHAGLGYAAELAGKFAEAHRHYEQAVGQDPGDAIVQFLYGESLLRTLGGKRPETDDDRASLEKARQAFRKSVGLRGDFGEAWARLGFADGLAPQPSPEGVEALATAVRLLPGRTDVALNLLLAYARGGDGDQARATLRRLEALGAEPVVLDQAREILLRLEFQEANQLVRRKELDDAVALYAHVAATTRDAALREQAEHYLEKMSETQRFHAFVALYRDVRRLLAARDAVAAAAGLEELEAAAKPGKQAQNVADLRDWLERLRAAALLNVKNRP